MGGSLSLIATFPDRPPVELSGLAEHEYHSGATRSSP